MAERKKRSRAWLYFTKINQDTAACNFCKTVISGKHGTTSNMLKHLASRHRPQLPDCGNIFEFLRASAPASQENKSSVTGAEETFLLLEPVKPEDPPIEAAAQPTSPPAKRAKLSSHQDMIDLEKERCILDIENAKLQKEVLLLKKEVLILQRQRLLDMMDSSLITI